MKILKNKKGEVYIYLCALLLAIIMLVSVVILYNGHFGICHSCGNGISHHRFRREIQGLQSRSR